MKNNPPSLPVRHTAPRLAALALVLPALILVSASAQPAGGPPRGRGPGGPGRGPGHPIVRLLDQNQDHEISAEELAAAPARLATLDTNGDGIISAAELRFGRPVAGGAPSAERPAPPAGAERPAPPADSARPHPLDPIMLALDANQDGALSADEIARATASLRALDLNGDGKLTPDEFRPLPPEGMPPRGEGRRGSGPSAPASE